jgi:hypothetical protein
MMHGAPALVLAQHLGRNLRFAPCLSRLHHRVVGRHLVGLLRARRERPRNCRAAEQRDELNGLIFEIIVVVNRRVGAGALRRGGSLQELRRVPLARLACRTFSRVAPDLGLQFDDVEKDVGLTA